jgi:hypothetical protein
MRLPWALLLYIGAVLAFMLCVVCVLMIFRRNKKHILDVFCGRTEDDPYLSALDTIATLSFFIAMLLSAILGISSAITTFTDNGAKMTTEDSKKTTQPTVTFDSVNGIGRLHPCNESFNHMADLQRSFQGMAQLQPQAQSQSSQTQASQAQASSAQSSQTGTQQK